MLRQYYPLIVISVLTVSVQNLLGVPWCVGKTVRDIIILVIPEGTKDTDYTTAPLPEEGGVVSSTN